MKLSVLVGGRRIIKQFYPQIMKSPRQYQERNNFHSGSKCPRSDHQLNNRWAIQLLKSVESVARKNQLKYTAILMHNSHFEMELYEPTISMEPENIYEINGKLLEKQLDSLLEDENRLNQEIKKINLKKQQHQQLRQLEIDSQADYYSVLKSIWRTSQSESAEDRIERLTQNVGSIKGHIKTLIEQQAKMKTFDFSEAVYSSKEYFSLKQKYQQSVTEAEDIQANLEHIVQKNRKQISRLRQENKTLKLELEQEKTTKSIKQTDIASLQSELTEVSTTLAEKQKQLASLSQYTYYGKEDIKICIGANKALSQSTFSTSKSFEQIHYYLTNKVVNKKIRSVNEEKPPRLPMKSRPSRNINEMKSADFKRPKCIRASKEHDQKKQKNDI